jgi:hypothetical protein
MSWDVLQQLVRIVLYSGGAFLFGQAVADGAQFQAFIGAVVQVIAFGWWVIRERSKAPVDDA